MSDIPTNEMPPVETLGPLGDVIIFTPPARGKWRGGWLGITFTPHIGEEPNWLRRKLTSWAFGVIWKRV